MDVNFREEAPLISSDLRNLVDAAYWLAHQLFLLDFGFSILKYIASMVAIFLFILDNRNAAHWRTDFFLSLLLILYIFFSLPSWIFGFFRGDFGKWIALIAVVFRFFLPERLPDSLKYPAALILLLVVAPDVFADTLRSSVVGVVVCLFIAFLLLEYIKEASLFEDYYRLKKVGIILLLVYPIWTLVLYIVGALFFVARGLIGIVFS